MADLADHTDDDRLAKLLHLFQACLFFILDSFSHYQSLIYSCCTFTICVIFPSVMIIVSSNMSGSVVLAVFVLFTCTIFTTTAFVAVLRSLSALKSTFSVISVGTIRILYVFFLACIN